MNPHDDNTCMSTTRINPLTPVILGFALFVLSSVTLADDFTYTTNSGNIVITGYMGPGGAVVIPETINSLPVTEIDSYAFADIGSITSVGLPATITAIGSRAFYRCTGLTGTLTIPDGVTTIGSYAFYNCGGLSGALTIPASVSSIGNYGFYSCEGFSGPLAVSSNLTSIGYAAFRWCDGLTGYDVALENTAYADDDGILYSKDMTTLIHCPPGKTGAYTIPEGVTEISRFSFYFCEELSGTLSLPSTITSIGTYAFRGCSQLSAFSVTGTNSAYTSVEGVLFSQDLTTLIQCPRAKTGTFIIPDGVVEIGNYAFEGCGNLTGSLDIPEGVTDIGTYAFRDCIGLTGPLTIPVSVDDIGNYAFRNCAALTAFIVDEDNTAYMSQDGVLLDKNQSTVIQCPGGKTGSFEMPPGVTEFAKYAFYNCSGLSGTLTVPAGTTSTEDLFAGCSSLTGIDILSPVIEIDTQDFSGCDSLETISVAAAHPSYATDSDGILFNKDETTLILCPDGKTGHYTVPRSVTSIAADAFAYSSLNSVLIQEDVASIGQGAFRHCYGLTAIDVAPGNLTYWSTGGVLVDLTQLSLIRCPGGKTGHYSIPFVPFGITRIADYSFEGCRSLTSVSIPASVTELGDFIFFDSDGGPDGLYFHGPAPLAGSFAEANNPLIFYPPEASGWGTLFGDRAAVPWDPSMENSGMQSGEFGFNILGTTGCMVVVEARDDLNFDSWSTVSTNTVGEASGYFSDPQTVSAKRYYRLLMP